MYEGVSVNLADGSGAERIEGARATHDLASVSRSGNPAQQGQAAVAVARLMADLLFGVPAHDIRILALATVTLIFMAALVNWLPARRAWIR